MKAKWVAALRSGKYEQAKGKLRIENAFCCLGVLCDVTGKGLWDHRYSGYCIPFVYEKADGFGFLPESLRSELGLPNNTQQHLTEMNDDDDKSFSEIADWVESNL